MPRKGQTAARGSLTLRMVETSSQNFTLSQLYPVSFWNKKRVIDVFHANRLPMRAVWRIRVIMIRIQGLKKFVTHPDPARALIRMRIQTKTNKIRIQAKQNSITGKSKNLAKNAHIPCFLCLYYLTRYHSVWRIQLRKKPKHEPTYYKWRYRQE